MAAMTPTKMDRMIERLAFGRSLATENVRQAGRKRFAFKRLLVAVDGSAPSKHAVAWAELVAKTFGSRVWIVHAVLPDAAYEEFTEWTQGRRQSSSLQKADLERGQRIVKRAVADFEAHHLEAEGLILHGFPASEIVSFAKSMDIDLLVVGSHGRGRVGRLLLGSMADQLKNHVAASVLIAKAPPDKARILIAGDGSKAGRRAAGIGLRLSHLWRSAATVLHVLHPPVVVDVPMGRSRLAEAFDRLGLPRDDRHLRFELDQGPPADCIVAHAAKHDAGLIVMGSRGLGGLKSLMAGSVSNRVSHLAKASVLLVKQPA